MKETLSKDEIIDQIRAEKQFLKDHFGVISIGLFGSYAKNQQTADSDIDLLVEFSEPRFDWMASLYDHLENKFNKRIEIVRKHHLLRSRFAERVEQEIIYA